ncbi:hypothetical protein AA0482_1668 [Acetobacter cibinongensis NRIC 0482]|nr:hypothetical protein AA0482_1668 [Acetobacter cibinongensis NRIC 0482]
MKAVNAHQARAHQQKRENKAFSALIVAEQFRDKREEGQPAPGKKHALEVKWWRMLLPDFRNEAPGEDKADNANRYIKVKIPPPRKIGGDKAAYNRPEQRAKCCGQHHPRHGADKLFPWGAA